MERGATCIGADGTRCHRLCVGVVQVFWSLLERFDECTDSVESHRRDLVARLRQAGIILHPSKMESDTLASGSRDVAAASTPSEPGRARDEAAAALARSQGERVEALQAALRTAQARAKKLQEENRRLR